ncbi:peptidase C14 caspase catalytic subunit p20 [[Leptolyngbya] sp. PCC 7376]|uniref:caspase family protein n=1 Tax=[Leptolyngbya] sp. PCC 7376 TaxID=111781 RepID=UPI00029F0BCD|nr:caspase family protein [[Leptolyngbya] sp. PCC 7376]AFY40356.1 peptidase C14 caspase catalytic subunit p20 [[Leptolyngbya] sp. PCC 7376]
MQYGRVLTQSTSRKLALLIGINGYPGADKLDGCVNDVQLQQELLIHRFGFNPKDILTVTDETINKPTRENILRAFEEHLIKQAKPGDVVVYHYSGHGSKVRAEDENSTFVPLDSQWKSGRSAKEITVDDIMGHTLYLLMSAIQTEHFTAVLDSCYSGGGTRGNTKIRSIERDLEEMNVSPSPKELAYQDYWLNKLGMSREEFKRGYEETVAKGMVLASAQEYELAADGTNVGYPAGAFTYALTQYLWQATGRDPLFTVMRGVGLGTNRISSTKQHPLYYFIMM